VSIVWIVYHYFFDICQSRHLHYTMDVAFSLARVGLYQLNNLCCTLFFFRMNDRPTYVLYVFPPLSFLSKKWAWLSCNVTYLVSSSLEVASTWLQCSSLDHSQIITHSSPEINNVASPHLWRVCLVTWLKQLDFIFFDNRAALTDYIVQITLILYFLFLNQSVFLNI
jgi:hypothetical protein